MNTLRNRSWLLLTLAGLMSLAMSCASGPIDDASGAAVVLEVQITDSPAITGQFQDGTCVIRITEWSAQFANIPKNSSATTSPYNDIIVEDIDISYSWPGAAGVTIPPERTIPSPGTVPANGSQSINFEPILLQDLSQDMLGTTGILALRINARTPVNDRITVNIGEALVIEQCQGSGGNTSPQAPTILDQPDDLTVFAGQSAIFTVQALGSSPLSFQWRRNGTNISGATQSVYTTPPTTLGESGDQFDCEVSNPFGTVTSNIATMTVNP